MQTTCPAVSQTKQISIFYPKTWLSRHLGRVVTYKEDQNSTLCTFEEWWLLKDAINSVVALLDEFSISLQ